ncbi:DUF418 domain-containing protein [Variovorax sp. JS1663]|uniref:DUF418 domain-containing protein n=1 Tax=Variovorax sp. JS1663 TaxID=1851577 RepID=UPI000B342806|nr:DUF418 domain-containing protein [Variovorax sp. JS1663]OUM03476.1 hypothetical protein A8M77_05285 [Variovorax sp. JS1663]
MPTLHDHPVNAPPPSRLLHLDALRGFALMGILMVNIATFASAYYGAAVPDPQFSRPADQLVRWLVACLFETKFYLLFSFLFGYSFTLQMSTAEHSGGAFVPRMLRRQLGLWLLGAAHAVWLYHGDILATYAVLGLILLALRRQSDPKAVRRACVLTLVPAVVLVLMGLAQLIFGGPADLTGATLRAGAAQQAWLGPPASVVAQRLRELGNTWWIVVLVQGPCALAMFMAGFVAGRRRMFARLDRYQGLWRRLPAWGLAVGAPGAVFYATATVWGLGTGWEVVGLGLGLLTAPFLTFAYVGLAMTLFHGEGGLKVAHALAPAGRMALSNYLLQSLACAILFTGYGLGLMGRVSPAGCVLIVLGLFGCQMVVSAWWLGRFRYGPVEWGLRALTMAEWPAMRKAVGAPVK